MSYLPNNDVTASGNITTQNLVPAGTATLGSAVEITLNANGTLSVQVTGTYTGALSLQATIDGTTWVTMGGIPFLNVNTGAYLATITSALAGIFQTDVSGFAKARITALAAVTGTATVSLRGSITDSLIALDAALPTGGNVIGHVIADTGSTTAVTGNVTAVQATGTNLHTVLDANSGVDIGKLTANQSVNTAQINGVTPLMGTGIMGTGSARVTIASDNDALTVKQATGTNLHVVLDNTSALAANQSVNTAQINAVTPLMGNGVTGTGSQRVTIASDNTPFPAKIDQTTPGSTNGVSLVPTTTGGLTTYHLVSAATTNLVNIKASAGQVMGWYIYNSNASARKLCLHNNAGTPTAGASIFFSLVIPATSAANVMLETGIAFSTGIAISTVTGLADTDATAVALNDLVLNIFYK